MARSRPLAVLAPVLLASSLLGCFRPVPIEGAQCPCPAGFACCPATGRCVRAGASCDPAGPQADAATDRGLSEPEPVPPVADALEAEAAPTDPLGPPDTAAEAAPPSADQPGLLPLRLLTQLEYNNTVRDLLGDNSAPANETTRAQDVENASGFSAGARVFASRDVRELMRLARQVATAAQPRLLSLLPAGCNPVPPTVAAQDVCAARFIAEFGARAFRRPLLEVERQDLLALFVGRRSTDVAADFTTELRVVVEGMLQSPPFLYRWEVGPPLDKDGPLVRLSPFELASRLSYFLWATMPDHELFRAADSGQLQTSEQIEAQVRRMLALPQARSAIEDFHAQWLSLRRLGQFEKLPPQPRALFASMRRETDDFVARVYLGPSGKTTLKALLTDNVASIDGTLAKLYGVVGAGPAWQSVELDPKQRAGILTQASFLAANSHENDPGVVMRGNFVARSLLCLPAAPPPNDLSNIPDPSPPGGTTRQRFEALLSTGCAKVCHEIYDLGFAFGNYDAVGRHQTEEAGLPIDAHGTLMLPSGPLTFGNAVELAHRLPDVPETQRCLAQQWLRYGLRRPEAAGDEISLRAAGAAFKDTQFELRELLVALSKTRSFTHRTASANEEMP